MKSIIYIDRNNLYFYGSNVHAPLSFPFQATTVRDIEIINAEELEKQLNIFIKNNKIEPTEVLFIIAHQSSFEKIIDPKTPVDQIEIQKKAFLNNVPFEETLSKTFVTDKGSKVIAVNKDLVYLIRDIFNKNNFNVEIISSIATLYPDGDITFNVATAQQILNKASAFKQNMFLLKDEEIPSTDMFEETYNTGKKVNKLVYLIPVFIILIGILVWLIMNQRSARRNNRTEIVPTQIPSSNQEVPAATNTPVASIEPVLLSKASISFQILNGSGIAGQADDIREILEEEGYSDIQTGNAPTLQTSKTLTVFKPRVPQEQQEEIVRLISQIVGDITTQINEEIDSDVLVTTSSN